MRVLKNGFFFTTANEPRELNIIAENLSIDIRLLSIHPDDLANYNLEQFNQQRRAAYNKAGCTLEALTVALFENDETEIARLKELQMQVKAEIPKPDSF